MERGIEIAWTESERETDRDRDGEIEMGKRG